MCGTRNTSQIASFTQHLRLQYKQQITKGQSLVSTLQFRNFIKGIKVHFRALWAPFEQGIIAGFALKQYTVTETAVWHTNIMRVHSPNLCSIF